MKQHVLADPQHLNVFVQESFAPIYPGSCDRWIREDLPPKPARYNRTVLDAEAAVERFALSGGNGVALRFAFLYGSDDRFTDDIFTYVRHGWLPILGRPEGLFPVVNHDDAAFAVVAVLNAPYGLYKVVDDEPLIRHEFGNVLAQMLNARSPRMLPRWVVRFNGGLGETLARSLRISNSTLRQMTGRAPEFRSARIGWHAALRSRTTADADRVARRANGFPASVYTTGD
jgi:nucleoside-diphosphate-sugar epimerase